MALTSPLILLGLVMHWRFLHLAIVYLEEARIVLEALK